MSIVLAALLDKYGYIVLLISLTLELIAFPLPGELLMLYCGFLVYEGKLSLPISILVAAVGTISGVTLSFFLGTRLGTGFFHKYGKYVHMGPDKIEKASKWFDSYGDRLLLITYFIPGVRHITGYVSGITGGSYKKFAAFSYTGALLWVSTFISLGKTLGPDWELFHASIKKYLIIICVAAGLILVLVYVAKKHAEDIKVKAQDILDKGMEFFHSLGKIKFIMAGATAAFLGFLILALGAIQDFLANEFRQYDSVVAMLVDRSLGKNYDFTMNIFKMFSSNQALVLVSSAAILFILKYGKSKLLEVRFLILTVLGGEVLETLLRNIFKRVGPSGLGTAYTFPSEKILMVTVVYGFFIYLLARHAKRNLIRSFLMIIPFIVLVMTAISSLYFKSIYPSDIHSGLIFGSAWLIINLIFLEVNRIIKK